MGERGKPLHTLRVAAVQVASQPGQIASNHAHAMPFIETAEAQGAQLIVLPELFSCGYIPNPNIWQYGETLTGPTVAWLRETSRRLRIYLGAGFLEVDGADFYNSFALTDPEGELLSCARKTRSEVYCFKYGAGRHILHTDLGTLGVGICADNHYSTFPKLMARIGIDILLMPHGSPMPYKTSKVISEADIEQTKEKVISLGTLYAEALGVPVIFANGVGAMQPMAGLLGRFMTPEHFRLRGFSRITDSDGALLGALSEEEGVLVTEVTLDPARKRYIAPPDYDGWLHEGSAMTRRVMFPLDIAVGRAFYALSRERRRLARRLL